MTPKALVKELLSMRKQAERTAQNIDQIFRNLSDKYDLIRQAVEEYGVKQVELIKQELQTRGMTWCTRCSAVIPESMAELVFVESREVYSCSVGYGNGDVDFHFRDFANLHRACHACRERFSIIHGQIGRYDLLAKDYEILYAFRVEKGDDAHYAEKFSGWVKLDDKNCKLVDEPSSQLVEKLAEEWNLPPRIEYRRKSEWAIFEAEFIVHE